MSKQLNISRDFTWDVVYKVTCYGSFSSYVGEKNEFRMQQGCDWFELCICLLFGDGA